MCVGITGSLLILSVIICVSSIVAHARTLRGIRTIQTYASGKVKGCKDPKLNGYTVIIDRLEKLL